MGGINMKCELMIDSSLLTTNDILFLNNGEQEICFSKTNSNNFLPPETILVLIELGQNIGYNAAYDAMKYALSKLIIVFTKKGLKEKTETKIEIACGDKRYSVSCNFRLTENQKDKLIDAAVKKLLNE